MYRLSSIIVFLFGIFPLLAQSPHGEGLKLDCAQCHNPDGWTIDDFSTIQFDHNTTNFELDGTHATTDCKACHNTLIFEETPTDCISCHVDIHNQSVGNDCMRCHDTNSWLVFNIPDIHEQNGFPLIGVHNNLSCVECHTNETTLVFNRIGNECIECHREDYFATQNPNHPLSGFSQNCDECHDPFGMDWGDITGINHDFFPLTLGHDIQDCSQCHDVTNFSDISADCFACHDDDYAQTTNPNHQSAGFPNDCVQCHTTNPGWMPALLEHDFFPLVQGHDIQNCNECHVNGNFNNTPTDCFACHEDDYNQTTNPNHLAAGFPTDCDECHTLSPGWMPVNWSHDFFPLVQGHDIQNCNECHINGNFDNTPTDCFACHEDDYNQTTDPNHIAAGFPTDCVVCHTLSPGWMPANWDHDGMYFPIYTGKHEDEWNDCVECHINPNNYSIFTCVTCHEKNDMNDKHSDVGGYVYESNACYSCHPNPL